LVGKSNNTLFLGRNQTSNSVKFSRGTQTYYYGEGESKNGNTYTTSEKKISQPPDPTWVKVKMCGNNVM